MLCCCHGRREAQRFLWKPAVVTGEVDADTAIVPADVLSKQALEGQAEDLALEDALYSLDKALQANSLTPEVYIKQVRPLNPAFSLHHARASRPPLLALES